MTARASAFRELQVPDMERRVADMIRLGTVSETDFSDPKAPRVRVQYGKNSTGWLPWTQRAGRARTWAPPKLGEQVIIASPSGDLRQGVVIGSINQNSRAAPASGGHETVTEWDSGIRESVDDDSKTYTLTIPAGGKFVVQVGGTSFELTENSMRVVTQTADFQVQNSAFSGAVDVQGDTSVQAITSSGKDISSTHRHANSGGPSVGGVPV